MLSFTKSSQKLRFIFIFGFKGNKNQSIPDRKKASSPVVHSVTHFPTFSHHHQRVNDLPHIYSLPLSFHSKPPWHHHKFLPMTTITQPAATMITPSQHNRNNSQCSPLVLHHHHHHHTCNSLSYHPINSNNHHLTTTATTTSPRHRHPPIQLLS